MSELSIRDLLAAVREKPPVFGAVLERVDRVQPHLLNRDNPNVPDPDLPAPLLELLERIFHPGPYWFCTHTAAADKLLTECLAVVSRKRARMPELTRAEEDIYHVLLQSDGPLDAIQISNKAGWSEERVRHLLVPKEKLRKSRLVKKVPQGYVARKG